MVFFSRMPTCLSQWSPIGVDFSQICSVAYLTFLSVFMLQKFSPQSFWKPAISFNFYLLFSHTSFIYLFKDSSERKAENSTVELERQPSKNGMRRYNLCQLVEKQQCLMSMNLKLKKKFPFLPEFLTFCHVEVGQERRNVLRFVTYLGYGWLALMYCVFGFFSFI